MKHANQVAGVSLITSCSREGPPQISQKINHEQNSIVKLISFKNLIIS